MDLRAYLGDTYVEDFIVKQFVASQDIRLFSREEAEAFVDNAFEYIEENGLTEDLLKLDKRVISQVVFRIATRPAEEYLWQVQQEIGLAGKLDTPDGPIYYYSSRAESIGARMATMELSLELSKRRGTSPIW